MAIEHRGPLQRKALLQLLHQALERGLGMAGIQQTADPQLEHPRPHREHPAVALGHPIAAEHEAQLLRPAAPTGEVELQQPLHPHAAHQGVPLRGRIAQQRPLLSGGIHHPAGLQLLPLPGGAPQLHLGTRAAGLPGLRTPAQAQLGTGAGGPLRQPQAELGEIQHGPEGVGGLPVAPLPAGPQQLPAPPARRDHRSGQAVLLHRPPGQGGTAEGRLAQIRQPVDQQHVDAVTGQPPCQIGTGGPGTDDQHLGIRHPPVGGAGW